MQKQLNDLYQQQDAATRFNDASTKLDQLAFENSGSLDAVSKALTLPVQTTDWFTRKGGSDIAANPGVITAAFSQVVLQDGDNSKPIAIDPQHLVVVRKAEYEAPRQQSQAEVADQIRDQLKHEQAAAKAQADAAALLKALDGGQSFEVATKAAGLAPVSPGAVQRDNKDLPPELLTALFKMPHPAQGKLAYGQATLDGGDLAVIALSSVSAPEAQSTDQGAVAASNTQQRNARAGAEFQAYQADMEKQVKVKIKATPTTTDLGGEGG